MVDFALFRYASAPRTASTWIRNAGVAAGLVENSGNMVHYPLPCHPNTLTLSSIRHPCDWMVSYWQAIYPGSTGIASIDAFRSDNAKLPFDDFVRHYLEHLPGGVGKLFAEYKSDVVIRVEDLPHAFLEFLAPLNIKFDSDKIKELGKYNISPRGRIAVWNPMLKQAVCDAEVEFMDRYEYWWR